MLVSFPHRVTRFCMVTHVREGCDSMGTHTVYYGRMLTRDPFAVDKFLLLFLHLAGGSRSGVQRGKNIKPKHGG